MDVELREEMCRQLAGNMHEAVGNDLVVLRSKLRCLKEMHPDQATLDECLAITNKIYGFKQRLEKYLYPYYLRYPIRAILKELVRGFNLQAGHGPTARLYLDMVETYAINEHTKLGLFRIAQEALLNARTHATLDAEIALRLHSDPSQLLLSVSYTSSRDHVEASYPEYGSRVIQLYADYIDAVLSVRQSRLSYALSARVDRIPHIVISQSTERWFDVYKMDLDALQVKGKVSFVPLQNITLFLDSNPRVDLLLIDGMVRHTNRSDFNRVMTKYTSRAKIVFMGYDQSSSCSDLMQLFPNCHYMVHGDRNALAKLVKPFRAATRTFGSPQPEQC